MFTHRYCREGRESRKFEDKCLLFDFEFYQALAKKTFIDKYYAHLLTCVALLNKNNQKGNLKILLKRSI